MVIIRKSHSSRVPCIFAAAEHTMKRLLVINPNTSNLFTQRIAAVARRSTELRVETVNPNKGPRSIESAYDELLSCAPTLETYLQARRRGPVDGVVVACFSDHAAVEALREISDGPVVGLLDAACATASLVGDSFGIATTSKSWEPLLRKGVDRLGYGDRCVDIRAIDMPVLTLEHENVEQALLDTTTAIASDVVILGCAGFGSEVARRTAAATGSSIIEPVEAAVRLCTALALQGLGTKTTRPLAQELDGLPEILAEAYAARGESFAVAAPAEPEANRALALYRRALRAARRCVPGQAATQEAYARQSFRANVGADARRAPGLLADAEDQIAFGESLLRRREAEESVAPAPQEAPREADDLLAYDDYLDGDALDRRLGSQ